MIGSGPTDDLKAITYFNKAISQSRYNIIYSITVNAFYMHKYNIYTAHTSCMYVPSRNMTWSAIQVGLIFLKKKTCIPQCWFVKCLHETLHHCCRDRPVKIS